LVPNTSASLETTVAIKMHQTEGQIKEERNISHMTSSNSKSSQSKNKKI
jgi:hypothetical protein